MPILSRDLIYTVILIIFEGLTIVGNNLAVADDGQTTRIWYAPLSTANDATSTIVREIRLTGCNQLRRIGIAAGLNDNLFVLDLG